MKNEKKIYNISIIGGCGHVGLPLGLVFAKYGHNVSLLDIDEKKVDEINSGIVPFIEHGASELLLDVLKKGTLLASTQKDSIKKSDFVIFVTGTPIDEHLNPRFSDVISVFNEYIDLISNDAIIIFRSTNYPGTFSLLEEILMKSKGHNKIAFCPERILQGKAIEEIETLPQIISSHNFETLNLVEELFKNITKKTIRLLPNEAEFAKLMTNSWRYIEFAVANQFYMMAQEKNVDFYKVYDAIRDEYPRAKNFNSPGLTAGPCLFKDTMQLSSFADNNFFIGHAAMLINEGMPRFIINQLEKMLGPLNGLKIGILGMTFKANNDDIRDSLSYKIKKEIILKSAIPLPTDPYLKEGLSLNAVLNEADALVLATPHKEYLNIETNIPYIDCWGAWRKG